MSARVKAGNGSVSLFGARKIHKSGGTDSHSCRPHGRRDSMKWLEAGQFTCCKLLCVLDSSGFVLELHTTFTSVQMYVIIIFYDKNIKNTI